MNKYTSKYVGLDVHKENDMLAVADSKQEGGKRYITVR
jgi:hypothetical protein